MKLLASLGVSETERSQVQPITISLRLWPQNPFDQLDDSVEKTVNYSTVAAAIRAVVAERADKLIETLAAEVAGMLLSRFALRKVQIELRKFVLPDADHVSVVISRHRESAS